MLADRARRPPTRWRGSCSVVGLMNVQFAIKDDELYVLEVNPRASRTVPFVAKAIGVPLAKLAAKVMAGHEAGGARLHPRADAAALVREGGGVPVRALPRRDDRARARKCARPARSWASTTTSASPSPRRRPPPSPACRRTGNVFLSVKDADKPHAVEIGRALAALGFTIYSTSGTAKYLADNGVAGEAHRQDQRGPPQRGRHDQERPDPDGDQHARRA